MSEETDSAQSGHSEDRVGALWRRTREHRIAQWTVGYVAVAYGIQHAVTLTSEAFQWPNAVARVSMLLLALGLPVAMTLAWYHGERVSRRVTGGEAAIVSLLLVLISFAFWFVVRPAEVTGARLASASAAAPAGAISLAVLPFTNMSGDASQEFFSDGMTEEITSALAKVPSLRVVGRTSAFQFKGASKDLRAIGQALSATHLIEGSVRKDGNQLRITAQLIKADDGTHLWSESYDRELKGVFAVQEDIAQAIAASLRAPLGLQKGDSLVSNRTADTKSYEDYLRARALVRARNFGVSLASPIALLEQVVAREPNYAPAWALLAQAYGLAPSYDPVYFNGSVEEFRRAADAFLGKAETAAGNAIRLDARSADGYVGLGIVQETRGKLLDAEQLVKQALALDALNPDALHWYSQLLAATGNLREALAMREQLRALEPLVPVYNTTTDRIFYGAGQNDKALALALALPLDNGRRVTDVARSYAALKKFREAGDALDMAPRGVYPPQALEAATNLMRTHPAGGQLQTVPYLGELSFAFLYTGAPQRALELYEHNIDAGYEFTVWTSILWNPDYRAVRKTERFRNLVRKSGLVEYWRAKGWPVFCHPMGTDDFACE